ncbi:hypothetical protein KY495_00975 [Massilia sp. PAMC28688]|uniref:hypothetical protein n=1 Tax=Massilia sp. PAMC28688 TaxID=2861283 RepID=UPI001C63219C|nr:hypothetical protein [Massilia sp. PAMC28688]QYF93847.1 hypothetical protein KY495_00975 [Massilia sp. PAMC28688]
MTGNSTLDPDNFPEAPDRVLGSGHGTGALGPSDTSDSGSDVVGAAGLAGDDMLDFDTGTTSDIDTSRAGGTAGPDVGDANLDSDSDSGGTGERATAGRDTVVRDGADIDVDHIEAIPNVALDEDDVAFLHSTPPGGDRDKPQQGRR